MVQVEGPCQVVDCFGPFVSVAGALGGSVACGQRLAGMPGEERMPVLRLHTAGETVGRAAAEPALILHKAGLFCCMRTREGTGSRAAKGKRLQAAHEEESRSGLRMRA